MELRLKSRCQVWSFSLKATHIVLLVCETNAGASVACNSFSVIYSEILGWGKLSSIILCWTVSVIKVLDGGWWGCLAVVLLAVGTGEEVPKANSGFGTIPSKIRMRKTGFKIIVWFCAVIIAVFLRILFLSWSDGLRYYLKVDWGYLDSF